MPKILVPEKLEPLLSKPKRFKIAWGGRGGSKSQTFADIFLLKSQVEQAKIACFREMQNSIEDSVHSLLKDEIDRLGLIGFTVDKGSIYNQVGGEFKFRGLSRNPDAVKSMHGFKYFWLEEGQSISEESLKMLTPTLRETGAEMWISMNRRSSEDPVDKRFIKPFLKELERDGYYEDDLHLIIKINYYDNPWFPEALEAERVWDYEHKSRAEYNHTWLGDTLDHVDAAIIRPEWFDAAIDAHKKLNIKPRGIKTIAYDPADSGADNQALAERHGILVTEAMESTNPDVNDGCDWALDYAIETRADLFVWDEDGMGVSLKRQINASLDGKRINPFPYRGSEGVERPDDIYQPIGKKDQEKTNEETFKNKRAQYHWYIRDRFYHTYLAVEKGEYTDPDKLISISSEVTHLQKLKAEMCRIPRKSNGAGLIQIMSKEEMKNKLKIPSYNIADAVIMSFQQQEEQKPKRKSRKVDTRGIV